MEKFLVNDEVVLASTQERAMKIYHHFFPGVGILWCFWLKAAY